MSSSDFNLLNEAEINQWHDTADVVIVGFGAAGASAAIEAKSTAENSSPVDVLVLERASGGGGTTASAAGHVYAGGGTPVQQAVGMDDSVESMFDYLMSVTPEPDEAKIRLYCEQSVAHFNWLEAQGVPFNRSFYRDKHVVQPTDECLIWSGNEKVWPYSEHSTAAARGHKVAKTGEDGGSLLMEKLIARTESLGVRTTTDAGVKHLIIDAEGKLIGVQYNRFKETYNVRANRGVILAAGGFSMNRDMLKEYCPKLASRAVYAQGNPNDDGSGIQLGRSLGGVVSHMDGCLITSPIYPETQLIKGLLINNQGRRFINEDSYHSRTTAAILDQPDSQAYLIVDSECFGRPTMMGQELIDGYETVAEMEQGLKLPSGSLVNTIEQFNQSAIEGKDEEFHKHKDWVKPLDKPPFAAFQCSLGKAVFVGFTLGGLKVSINAEVLNNQDKPIPGLYAAGACASNIAQDGTGYSSGTCIGEATFFGRRAGRFAAQASG